MKIFSQLKIAYQSIVANKGRNILTVIGLSIGITAVIVIMSVGNGLKSSTLKSLEMNSKENEIQLIPNGLDDFSTYYSDADLQLINSTPGVVKVTVKQGSSDVSGHVDIKNKRKKVNIQLIDKSSNLFKIDLNNSGEESRIDLLHDQNVVFVSKGFGKDLTSNNVTINKSVFKYYVLPSMYSDIFKDSQIIMNRTAYYRNFGNLPGRDTISIDISKGWNKKVVLKNVVKKLQKYGSRQSEGRYFLTNSRRASKNFAKIIDYLTYFIVFVAAISLFIAGVGVMNTMYMTVSERNQEIGIRRVFGATKEDITCQFLIESSLICILGGSLGVLGGFIWDYILKIFMPFNPIIDIKMVLVALIISVAVGLIFGIIPAKKAAKENLISIL